jgi:hypothetical protein
MRPDFSASSSILTPMRSFTEPPGFMYSHFARSSQSYPLVTLFKRTIGVWPTASRMSHSMPRTT